MSMHLHLRRFAHVVSFKWLAVGGTLLGLTLGAHAMDLLQAYKAAQLHDATIFAARANAVAERERLPQAKSQLLPSLNASVSRSANRLASVLPNFLGEEKTSFNDYPSSNKTLTLRQSLYRPQLTAQYRLAKAQVDDAEAALQQEEQNLAVRVGGAYFETLLAHEQLALIQAQQAAYAARLDAARKSFTAGSGTRTDIDEAQARLDMTLALEIEARQNISYTLQQLEILINQPIDKLAPLHIAQLELSDPEPNSLADWVARAELNSPQLQSLKVRVEVARQETRKAEAGHYPTLDAVAQWSRSEGESVTSFNSRYTNQSVGLQLNIPIYSGGYLNSTVQQTLAGLERAEQTLEAGRRDLGLRVHKEFRGITENISKIKALEQALRSADQLVLSSTKSFHAGSRTAIDILNAEQQRALVSRDLAHARYLYLISKVRLLALVGGADLEAVMAINRAFQD